MDLQVAVLELRPIQYHDEDAGRASEYQQAALGEASAVVFPSDHHLYTSPEQKAKAIERALQGEAGCQERQDSERVSQRARPE